MITALAKGWYKENAWVLLFNLAVGLYLQAHFFFIWAACFIFLGTIIKMERIKATLVASVVGAVIAITKY